MSNAQSNVPMGSFSAFWVDDRREIFGTHRVATPNEVLPVVRFSKVDLIIERHERRMPIAEHVWSVTARRMLLRTEPTEY